MVLQYELSPASSAKKVVQLSRLIVVVDACLLSNTFGYGFGMFFATSDAPRDLIRTP